MDAIYREADGYIFKPFGVDDLLEEVSVYLGEKERKSLFSMKDHVRVQGD
jgi:hypothetical protein